MAGTTATYSVGKPIDFSGYVDDFAKNVSAMQFSLDDGAHWTEYPVNGALQDRGITWHFTYTPEQPGWYCLSVRAVDGSGQTAELVSTIPFLAVSSDYPHIKEASSYPGGTSALRLRAIGGGSLSSSKIFRSGELSDATPADAQFIDALGIQTVYDIRTQREVAAKPDPLFPGVFTVSLAPSWETRRKDADKRLVAGVIGEYGAPEERMQRNYRRYVHEYPLIGTALRTMAERQTPALIHCVNGKDRTGVLCAVLQRLAGVSMDAIMDDYLAYNALNKDRIEEEAARLSVGMNADERAVLMSFLEARPSYLQAFFSEIESCFGNFGAYIANELRITPTQREALQALVYPS